MSQRMKNWAVPLTVILVAWVPFFMGAFDKDKPAASTSLRSSNPEILANWTALQAAINLDHEFSGTSAGTQTGKHEVLTMQEESSAGASSTNEGHFQIIDGGSQPELAFTSEDGDELQFTKDGDLYSSDNLQVVGTSTFTGAVTANAGITLGAGDDLIGSATSDITFNTNKFTVAGATGNTLVGGTLDVVGNIDPTTYETTRGGFLDEDDLASDAANKVASQQSIKAYADSLGGSGQGFVKAFIQFNSSGTAQGTPFNASSSRNSAGLYTVTWGTDFADGNYVVIVTGLNTGAVIGVANTLAVGSCKIETFNSGGTNTDSAAMVIAIGTQ
jgi:hypothetical protein